MADTEAQVEPVEDPVEEEAAPAPIPLQYQAIAYSALLIMALIPIWIGSKRANRNRQKRLQDIKEGNELDDLEVISSKEAAKFPIMASITLFSIYLLYKYFADKMYYFVTGYFFLLGVAAVTAVFEPLIAPKLTFIFPLLCPDADYQLTFKENKKEQFDLKFTRKSLVVVAAAAACGGAYLYNQHWIANNIIGLCFAIQGVEMLSLPNYKTGAMLLGGLFFYDVFWVFGTDVMVTVAKTKTTFFDDVDHSIMETVAQKFDAPIKLIFPANIFDAASKSSMLGLGDIVIPGILVALMLRLDNHIKPGSQKYFLSTFVAYILGLAGTIVVMHVFKHAQPALLYLVPACLGAPLLVALVSGEMGVLFEYNEEEEEDEEEEDEKKEK